MLVSQLQSLPDCAVEQEEMLHAMEGRRRITDISHDGNSLEKDQSRRASPWRMLEHPWMVEIQRLDVDMALFLARVWGWEE